MEITENEFLGGRITLRQPRLGYRAGVDPVFLAASIPAKAGQSVLELGCGVGAALFCLAARVDGLDLTGIEVQANYAVLAQENAVLNGIDAAIVTADLRALPADLRQRQFDHVIANPPYFDRSASSSAADEGRETAMGEGVALADWCAVAARRLKRGGYASFIHRAERLPDLLAALPSDMGAVQVLPLTARAGRDAGLILLRARKGARAAFRLCAPLILHQGAAHERDGESYTETVSGILRLGNALDFPI